MEISKLQEQIDEFNKAWEQKRGYKGSEQICFNHLIEEVGELSRQFVNKDTGRDKCASAEIENAIGDIFIHLIDLANKRGLDIEKTVLKILEKDTPESRLG
ncbi:MAG: hypothetical protein KKG59_04055 [Nanoarchaeota archaeon]|nr:hypothetical protein [Nanoarchaeota archaeon]